MSVYVDNMRTPFRRGGRVLLMSHMLADSSEELQQMASKLNLNPGWIQSPGTWREHYDVSAGKRAEAIGQGALAVDTLFLVKLRRRKQAGLPRAES